MKVFNIVLSVLILLLAITAAVFAYFLFEKREQITKWGNDMGDTIRSASAIMDKDSGTMVAGKLDKKSLSHLEAANLAGKMNEFKNQVTGLEAQRDALAEALVKVISATGNSVGDLYSLDKFQNVETYPAIIDYPRNVAASVKNQVDTIARQTVGVAKALEYPAKLSADAAFFSDPAQSRKAYDGMIAKAEGWVDETKVLRSGVKEVFNALGSDGYAWEGDPVDAATSKSAVEQVKAKATALVKKAAKLTSDLNAANDTIRTQNAKISGLEKNVAELNSTLAAREDEIAKLNAVINSENGRLNPEEWAPGSVNSRRAMRGNVIDINRKFGIVTIDLGKNTRVRQLVGRIWTDVDPLVEQLDKDNLRLVVMRTDSDGHAEYVAQLKIVRVDDACSIAEIVREDASKDIEVGDFVVIAEEDLEDAAK